MPEITESEKQEATVYEYKGRGTANKAVKRVKIHHSQKHGLKYRNLTAKKVAQGGAWNKLTTVVVIGPAHDSNGGVENVG